MSSPTLSNIGFCYCSGMIQIINVCVDCAVCTVVTAYLESTVQSKPVSTGKRLDVK